MTDGSENQIPFSNLIHDWNIGENKMVARSYEPAKDF
jgi:hypothetical protein